VGLYPIRHYNWVAQSHEKCRLALRVMKNVFPQEYESEAKCQVPQQQQSIPGIRSDMRPHSARYEPEQAHPSWAEARRAQQRQDRVKEERLRNASQRRLQRIASRVSQPLPQLCSLPRRVRGLRAAPKMVGCSRVDMPRWLLRHSCVTCVLCTRACVFCAQARRRRNAQRSSGHSRSSSSDGATRLGTARTYAVTHREAAAAAAVVAASAEAGAVSPAASTRGRCALPRAAPPGPQTRLLWMGRAQIRLVFASAAGTHGALHDRFRFLQHCDRPAAAAAAAAAEARASRQQAWTWVSGILWQPRGGLPHTCSPVVSLSFRPRLGGAQPLPVVSCNVRVDARAQWLVWMGWRMACGERGHT
jgi:hypothetical protein